MMKMRKELVEGRKTEAAAKLCQDSSPGETPISKDALAGSMSKHWCLRGISIYRIEIQASRGRRRGCCRRRNRGKQQRSRQTISNFPFTASTVVIFTSFTYYGSHENLESFIYIYIYICLRKKKTFRSALCAWD